MEENPVFDGEHSFIELEKPSVYAFTFEVTYRFNPRLLYVEHKQFRLKWESNLRNSATLSCCIWLILMLELGQETCSCWAFEIRNFIWRSTLDQVCPFNATRIIIKCGLSSLGSIEVKNDQQLKANEWYTVTAVKNLTEAKLIVAGEKTSMKADQIPGSSLELNVNTNLFIGGINPFTKVRLGEPQYHSFKGCIASPVSWK